jgi:hypothetical protein
MELRFTRCRTEHGLYTRVRNNSRLVVGVYIDDPLIVGECVKEIDQFKGEMKQSFRMSDLGPLSYYLGIKVKQGRRGVELCQSAYAKKLLEKACMAGCNGCVTPMEQLTHGEAEAVQEKHGAPQHHWEHALLAPHAAKLDVQRRVP